MLDGQGGWRSVGFMYITNNVHFRFIVIAPVPSSASIVKPYRGNVLSMILGVHWCFGSPDRLRSCSRGNTCSLVASVVRLVPCATRQLTLSRRACRSKRYEPGEQINKWTDS